ncbi:PepSY domain-containing protein [Nonomuraea fuscirosea]|uniref:PepSY domain-containing protein n=1 Tax=Nonomuraea fuscirosea TaxID=1291556 RepID=UPI002DDBD318|nr:PepSY domain-containing protein [Nonomuraea fuscirosea]WSA49288.1 PepSY domain-containing protein [Nonomuraea fuscirosea]
MQITKKFIVAGAGVVALIGGGGAAYAATTSAAPAAPKVTAEQAIEIAHKTVPGAWVSELDFDSRGTRADVWELELTKGSQRHEVKVDAASGKVVKNEIDRNDRDDDHDGDDDD